MNKLIKKMSKKLSIATVLFLAVLMVAGFSGIAYVFATDHTATQEASSGSAETISIVSQNTDDAVSTITFPEGAPGATISDPYNNIDTATNSQFLDATNSEPVVRLKNTSGGTLNVTLEITDWTNGIAASQDYELVDPATNTIEAVAQVLSSDGNTATVSTGTGIDSTSYAALYLELTLSGVAGQTGTSTLTVLGETP